jgi:PQQ-dependent catabolism-associated beta-propeller protein
MFFSFRPGRHAGLLLLAALGLTIAVVAHAKDSGKVFVSSEKDHTLTVIDAKTMAVSGVIKTCKRPRHMKLIEGNTKLMVACSDSSKADIIDIASGKSVARIAFGDDPEVFDLSLDGKTAYLSAEDEGALTVVDMATGKAIKSIPVGKEPEGVLTSPDGKRVYVTSEVANMVHVVDPVAGSVVKNIAVGKRPRRMILAADGKELWVTNELGSSVSIVSTADLNVIDTIKFEIKGMRADDISPVGIALSRDGKTAYVALGRANHVAWVDVASRKLTNTVLVGKRAWYVALTRDGSRMFVANGLSDDVTVVDVAAVKALKSIPVGRVPYGVVIDD